MKLSHILDAIREDRLETKEALVKVGEIEDDIHPPQPVGEPAPGMRLPEKGNPNHKTVAHALLRVAWESTASRILKGGQKPFPEEDPLPHITGSRISGVFTVGYLEELGSESALKWALKEKRKANG